MSENSLIILNSRNFIWLLFFKFYTPSLLSVFFCETGIGNVCTWMHISHLHQKRNNCILCARRVNKEKSQYAI